MYLLIGDFEILGWQWLIVAYPSLGNCQVSPMQVKKKEGNYTLFRPN